MPYQNINKVPQDVQKLPRRGQLAFKAVFNREFAKDHNEIKAFKHAWALMARTGDKSYPLAANQTVEDCRQTIARPMIEETT
jgi:cation transport regulator ChaB